MADKTIQAEAAKERGNDAFKNKDFPLAIECFTEAIECCPEKVEYLSNRSAAYMKTGQYEEALADAQKCISLAPTWGKGYVRKGAVQCLTGDLAGAVATYCEGISHEPDNELLSSGLASAQKAMSKKRKNKKKKGKKGEQGEFAEEAEQGVDDYVIGIDLGTTYSCVGVWKDDGVVIIENDEGKKTIPSYVCFEKDGSRKVGYSAKNQTTRNPKNTIYDVKRIIGQRFHDHGVEADIAKFHYDVVANAEDKPMVKIQLENEEKLVNPEEVSAMVLSYCKEVAEKFLGQPVKRAVVTVPAYFNDSQRAATKAAGMIAGLDVLRIINEPTAAALAYGLDNIVNKDKAHNVLIFDLGGGTFDVSVLTIEGGIFTVKATGGDTRLGGEDFDNNLVQYLVSQLSAQGFPDPTSSPRDMQRLRKAAEIAKREISSSKDTTLRLDAFMGNKDFITKVTREKFEALNKGLFTSTMATVTRVLKDSKLKNTDINEIILVGGSTRIPKLQEMLSEMFGGKAPCKSLNPDEAVAYGAAVQGAILNGKRNSKTDSLLLMDVTPLSLGIETTGRVMSVIIPRNTQIPCVKTQTYTTEQNYQTQVDISVYEGERGKSDENNLLGEFTISGIEAAKRGEPQIDVSFAIDSNGILKVTAIDQKTKAKADIQINNRSRATTEEIDRMVAEANKYKEEDAERVRKIEAKNEFEQAIFDVLEAAKECDDAKLADILNKAADKEQQWLEENYETCRSSEMNLRKRALTRRLESKQRIR